MGLLYQDVFYNENMDIMLKIFDVAYEPSFGRGASNLPPWLIALIIVGSVILIVGIAILFYFLGKIKK